MRKKGRPATGKMPTLALRAPDQFRRSVEQWAAKQTEACRVGAEGEKVMLQNHSLLLGVSIGLFCALAILTVHYVAGVIAG
jgi:hypothetical protein